MEHFSPQDTKNVAGRAGGGPSPGPPSQYPQSGRFQQPSPPVGPPHSQQHQMPRGSTPPQQQGGAPVLPSGPPQLPPQLFTTAAQLLDLTDSEIYLGSPCDIYLSRMARTTVKTLYIGGRILF
ncbi:SM-like, degradation of cytoplasmic mRNAs and positively regulates transcription initiation [Coccidioides posadasii str. Silveira]|uniref:SM-like, degradation of cytoplasmic mRNAs and positively regulates transcription initiation n=1 Tax=Coccidioides posadasii (strain RMSCC 757 / Silveira) TaxID=443226 RepID=UPI001BF09D6E|nr:SM-like, degradation of cytoplasmic mRNAs and positively regulates transcription initiation [Coccidioides posadasii str. Silveira]